jgi:hypothetical protein
MLGLGLSGFRCPDLFVSNQQTGESAVMDKCHGLCPDMED